MGKQNKRLEEMVDMVQKQVHNMVRSLDKQRVQLDEGLEYMRSEVRVLRIRVDSGVERADKTSEDATTTVTKLEKAMDGLKEEMWELDTNNRNNLVFYGIREEGTGSGEAAVREVIKRWAPAPATRPRGLNISREIPLTRVRRVQGAAVRGTRSHNTSSS